MSKDKNPQEMERLLTEGPPLEWYLGFGHEDTGIQRVTLHERFNQMGEGKAGEYMNDWYHLKVNPYEQGEPDESLVRERQVIAEAEAFVTSLTGYSPRQIRDKGRMLTDFFRGQQTAPFEFELFPPRQ